MSQFLTRYIPGTLRVWKGCFCSVCFSLNTSCCYHVCKSHSRKGNVCCLGWEHKGALRIPDFGGRKEVVPSDMIPQYGGPRDIWWNDSKLGFKMEISFFLSETAELILSVIYRFDFSSFKPFLFPINHFMEIATYYSFFVLELNHLLNEGGLEKWIMLVKSSNTSAQHQVPERQSYLCV